ATTVPQLTPPLQGGTKRAAKPAPPARGRQMRGRALPSTIEYDFQATPSPGPQGASQEPPSMAHPDLSPQQRVWFKAADALIDVERLYQVNREVTAIHSPTGRERAASEYMARYLGEIGVEARYQPMDEFSGNAIGRIRGSGGGP